MRHPRDTNKSSTALRAFQVLEAVARNSAPLSVAEISRRVELDRATCYRMLRTIEEAGYLVRDAETKNFRMSRRVVSLAKHLLAEDEDRLLVSQTLKRISAASGETSHYSELDRDGVILTQRSKGIQLVAVDFQIGERSALHTTSVGKAILAFQPPDFVEAYLKKPLARLTPHTITDPAALRAELGRVRESGLSYDHYELALGMKCVAAPTREADASVRAGISISGPDSRFTEARLRELGELIAAEAAILYRMRLGEDIAQPAEPTRRRSDVGQDAR
jgi:DNA-binding IclR family transcriptional regulator